MRHSSLLCSAGDTGNAGLGLAVGAMSHSTWYAEQPCKKPVAGVTASHSSDHRDLRMSQNGCGGQERVT